MLILTGDGSQSIYGFRGACPEVFCGADKRLRDVHTLHLPSNYRSLSGIVAVGNAVAADIGAEWTAGLVAQHVRAGEATIKPLVGRDPLFAAYVAADTIAAEVAAGRRKASDFAILIRTNNAAALYEGALMARGIPCVRWGGTPFWERKDVLGFVGYGLLSAGGERGLVDDVTLVQDRGAFRAVINRPLRYLPRAWADAVVQRVHRGEPLIGAIRSETAGIRSKQRGAAMDLASFIERSQRHTWPHVVSLVRAKLLEDTPKANDEQPDEERRAVPATCAGIALREMYDGRPLENGLEFAMYADASARNSERTKGDLPAGKVIISTIHKYKGLQQRCVILPMDHGLFPHKRSLGSAEREAEELRLLYVAVTRAQDALYIVLSTQSLDGDNIPESPFLRYFSEDVQHAARERMRAVGEFEADAEWVAK